MGYALCDRTTGRILMWVRYRRDRDNWNIDQLSQVVVEVDLTGPRDNYRWDGNNNIRPATPAEIEAAKPQSDKDREADLQMLQNALQQGIGTPTDKAVWRLLLRLNGIII